MPAWLFCAGVVSALLEDSTVQTKSFTGRRLLADDDAPQTNSFYCYPSGSCNLFNVSAGLDGFNIWGSDAISSFGHVDINGDGLSDIVLGSPQSTLNIPLSNTGRTYVVFGSKNRTGVMQLFPLMDGVRGFAIDGDIANRQTGLSVSDAGDVNADGTHDLLIGASCVSTVSWDIACRTGRSYVIYGNSLPGVWGDGRLRVQNFTNGERGFAVLGENTWGFFGTYSGSAGDVNGDDIDDFVISAGGSFGSNTSLQIFVIFGSRNSSDGFRNVSTLTDGQHGFVYQSPRPSEVAGAQDVGDINADGLPDLVIFSATENQRAIVVFGSQDAKFWATGTWNESTVNSTFVGATNMQRGLFTQGLSFGRSIKGDVNGDGVSDLILVDLQNIVVIFGSGNASFWPYSTYWDFRYTYADGVRGFHLFMTYFVIDSSHISDFNDDGIDDLIFTSMDAMNAAGAVFVLFGTRDPLRWVKSGPPRWNFLDWIGLLDGERGFYLQGDGTPQRLSKSVSADFNGDHVADLLVQFTGNSFYGVYGSPYSSFLFRKNTIYLTMGQSILLTLNNIDVNISIGAVNVNDTYFIVANLSNGMFTFISAPSVPLSNFSRKDISDSLIQFVHSGDPVAPGYRLIAVHPELRLKAIYSIANVEFYVDPSPPRLDRNQATVEQGNPLILSSNNLMASDPDGPSGALIFIIRGVQYARFDRLSLNGTLVMPNVLQFEQQEIFDGLIRLVPDGGRLAPAYKVAVSDGNSTTPDHSAAIQFLFAPVLFLGSIVLNPGEANTLTSHDLNASDVETLNSELIFEVSNVSQGFFLLASGGNATITNFSQILLLTSKIMFMCPAIGNVSFFVRVFDGHLYSPWQSPSIRFNRAPFLQVSLRDISIEKDRRFDATVGPINIFDDLDGDPLTYNARLANKLDLPETVDFIPPNRFQGYLLGVVELTIVITATDSRGLSASGVFVLGNLNSRPRLTVHPMIVDEGQATTIRYQNLQAEDVETLLAEDLVIEVGAVSGGHFFFAGSDGNITAFRQLVLILGTVQFMQEGEEPEFSFRASDGRLESDWQAANLTLNHRPRVKQQYLPLRDQEGIQGEEFVFSVPSLFEDPDGDQLKVAAHLQGGLPLPKEIQFTPPNSFRCMMPSTGSFVIVVEATDPRQLTANTTFGLSFRFPPAVTDLKAVVTSFSSIGGVGLSIAAFLWIRRRIASHRKDFQFANALRFTLNLEYYDFTRFIGDTFKTRVNDFLQRLQLEHREFLSQLTIEERNSFAVCVAEILTKRGLVSRSGYGEGLFGLLCFLNVGWSSQLDLQQFEAQSISIAAEAVNAWNSQSDPVSYWPYKTFQCKEQLKVMCCCSKPSHENRWFVPDQGVSLASLRKREVEEGPAYTRVAVLEEQTRQMALTIKILSDEAAERKCQKAT